MLLNETELPGCNNEGSEGFIDAHAGADLKDKATDSEKAPVKINER